METLNDLATWLEARGLTYNGRPAPRVKCDGKIPEDFVQFIDRCRCADCEPTRKER